MTKDAMMLLHELSNNSELKSTEIYELYSKTLQDYDDIVKYFDLISYLDEMVYDFEFLTTAGKELNAKRSTVNELLQGMCEQVGHNIELLISKQPLILKKYKNCPINSEYILLIAIQNEDYADLELSKSNYSRFSLGKCKKI